MGDAARYWTDRRFHAGLAALFAIGLGLRIAAAQGGLWLDEAWSAVLARDAGTPLGIFLNINHDNNHHLNSLWMQTVGFGAAPWLSRGLSIVSGSVAILIAGLIGARRGAAPGVLAALLFAISPLLVTLGSEARGYAPMALALLVAVLLVDRALAGEAERSPATALALCFFLGALSQLTMVFGFCAIAGWVFVTLWQREGMAGAITGTQRLMLPSLVALGLVAGIVFGAAAASPTGFQFGRYDPFGWTEYRTALAEMLAYATGVPAATPWLLMLPPVLLGLAARTRTPRLPLYALAVLAFPLALAVLHAGNVGHPRYYLVAGLALLLLLAEVLAAGLRAGPVLRAGTAIALAALVIGSLAQDADLIRNQRGDPGAAIRAMQARAPGGTRILLDRPTGLAVLEAAAADARYPLEIVQAKCPTGPARPIPFLFIDRFRGEPFPAAPMRCGSRYVPIAQARARGLSGSHWTLYAIAP